MKEGVRSFTVVELMKPAQLTAKRHSMKKTGLTNDDGGRFESKDPAGAARKAFNQACRDKDIKGQCTLVVKIQETTAGSRKKVYTYKLKRIKLKKPIIMVRGGVEYPIEYDTKIESLNKANKD
tara:strand:+ start:2753 stop:3121 length:369 start_codon:yes stop_codon:yes gene_type:complete